MSDKHTGAAHRNGGFQSSLGFVLACVGSAVGMANIWLFPYRLGQYGGAAFLIPYILFIVLFGLVGLSAEFAIGRKAHTGTLGSFAFCWARRGRGKLGHAMGWIPLFGSLGIAIADSLCNWLLSERFAALHTRYPGITLQVIPAGTEEMFRLLNRNEVDLVFTMDHHIYHRDYVIVDEEQMHIHFVAAADSALRGRLLTPAEIVNEPFLLTEKGMSYRRLMDEQLARLNLEATPILESGNTDLLCKLVAQGMGIAYLPEYVTEKGVADGTLCYLQVEGIHTEVWKQLFHHRDKWVSPQMKIVMEYLTKRG